MSEDVKAKIFDLFFICQRDVQLTRWGLPFAHQIVVEKHGGAIEVDSTLGQGTEFIILLPVRGS
jgi:signal transduction histidine kinase